MSFVKMFRELLSSSVWVGSPPHVKLVWVTLMLMKDQDGLVKAAVPGLAKEAEVSIEECLDALARFHAPDPHSRTREHEGRRIVTVDGGWLILNHEKYRDKENVEERREKAAERQRKKRSRSTKRDSHNLSHAERDSHNLSHAERDSHNLSHAERDSHTASHSVTPRTAPSRHTDTNTDLDLPEAVSGSGSGSSSSPSREPPDPDQRGGGEREQAATPPRPALAAPRRAAEPIRDESRGSLVRSLTREHVARFNRVRQVLGLDRAAPGDRGYVPAMQPMGDPAEREVSALIRDQVSLEGFRDRAMHALAVREDEAERIGSLKFFGATMWRAHNFATTAAMQVGEDRRAPAKANSNTGRFDPEGIVYPDGEQEI